MPFNPPTFRPDPSFYQTDTGPSPLEKALDLIGQRGANVYNMYTQPTQEQKLNEIATQMIPGILSGQAAETRATSQEALLDQRLAKQLRNTILSDAFTKGLAALSPSGEYNILPEGANVSGTEAYGPVVRPFGPELPPARDYLGRVVEQRPMVDPRELELLRQSGRVNFRMQFPPIGGGSGESKLVEVEAGGKKFKISGAEYLDRLDPDSGKLRWGPKNELYDTKEITDAFGNTKIVVVGKQRTYDLPTSGGDPYSDAFNDLTNPKKK